MSTHRRFIMAVMATAAIALTANTASARNSHSKQELQQTGADDDARGLSRFGLRNGTDGRFQMVVKNLEPHTAYQVIVNGVKVSEIETNGGGSGRIRFRTTPHGRRDEILGFDPRGASVSIRSMSGDDVLTATIPDGPADDPDKITCCVPDDDRTECEDRTPERCAAEGGVVSTATSCLPNPCSDLPPLPDMKVICCLPDDSGPECEDRTPDQCALQGGLVVEATSCTPNPCAPVILPPGEGNTQCCLPDDSGPECEDRTPDECAALGGIDAGPGTCTPNPCAGLPLPPVAEIQCCVPHDGSFECETRTPEKCSARGGTDMGPGTCLPSPCGL